MFQELELTNFRQHTKLSINFTAGVNALRGANEAGKTTVLESIAYALGGANMLRDSLSETVTYGQKDSTLKVRLVFAIDGVTYTLARSKSGAEIKAGLEVLATGQTETRKYVENLLGASMDTASLLMLANQQDIRGALNPKKSGEAVTLIEKLANFSLIDKIITQAQGTLPCGTTTAVKSRLATLEQQALVPVEDDTGPFLAEAALAEGRHYTAKEKQKEVRAIWDADQRGAAAAVQRNVSRGHAELEVVAAAASLEAAKRNLGNIKVEECPANAYVAELRKRVMDAGRLSHALKLKVRLIALKAPANEWEGTADELHKAKLASEQAVRDCAGRVTDSKNLIGRLEAKMITETHCGLCGKDLAEVPEVVTKNAATTAEITLLSRGVTSGLEALEAARQELDAINEIQQAHHSRQGLYAEAKEFIELDEGYVPARWTWVGPEITETLSNPTAELATAEAKIQAHSRAVGQKQQAEQSVADAVEVVLRTTTARDKTLGSKDADALILANSASLTSMLYAADTSLRDVQEAHKTAVQAANQALAVLRERQNARESLESQRELARVELQDMEFNNALIARIREVRPEIADELWGMVLNAVSTDFSAIRGTLSKVTRSDNAFRVDGQSVAGLSGSTLDSLGLAIRKSLTRMFLPAAGFMVLDEPAAACDPEREAAMLGLIATSEFDQVLLVTHSDLADSFAANVIQL